MRIRSLEIAGFKSFAQRATLVFEPGISAIVGPNGCGKSNIVDAIRWVMGEQNPRLLRGRRMEDLIFGGTQHQSPSGLAEVVMTLDNADGSAPGEFRGFAEIEITRRLYRSGESEYLINKVPMRLRDVLDFFLDTGIGTRGYTIVEQGAIAGIVSNKPEERRAIFEEAAGIGKYRARRAETLSKLKSTEQNLVRVNDVLSELVRSRDSLERQAKRARRHAELSARVRELDLAVTSELYAQGEVGARELERELAAGREALLLAEARASQLEAALAGERVAQLERDRELAQANEQLYELRSASQALESRSEFERREAENLERQAAQRAEEREALAQRLARSEAERAGIGGGGAESDAELEASRTALTAREREREQQRLALREGGARRDAARSKAGERAREAAGLLSRREALNQQQLGEQRRLAAGEAELEAGQAEAAQLEAARARLTAELEAHGQERARAAEALTAAQLARTQAREAVAARTAELAAARAQLAERGALLAALREQERRAAARVGDVVAKLAPAAREALRGHLWQQLEVDAELEGALEAALAPHAEALLFDSIEPALAFLEALRASDIGRAAGLVVPPRSIAAPAGFVPLGRPLAAHVRAPAALMPLVERLLRDVYVVERLSEVAERYGVSDPPAVFVTPGGERLERSGVLTGGSGVGSGGIARAAEIRRRAAELATLTARAAELEAAVASASAAEGDARRALEQARERQQALELAARDLSKDAARAKERCDSQQAQLGRLRAEQASRASALAARARELEQIGARAEAAERERTELEAETAALASSLEAQSSAAAALEAELGAARVALAEQRARRDEQRASAQRLDSEIAQHRAWIEQRSSEIASAQERGGQLREASSAAEHELAERAELEAAARAEQEALRAQFEAGAAQIEQLEQHSRTAARELAAQQQGGSRRELALQELRLRQDQQRERMRERYSIDLANYAPPESAAAETPADPEVREAELKRLRAALESLGGVNMSAIEEYEGVAERHRYLAEQKADLELSIERLQDAIGRINRTSRARFRETFDAVNRCFQELFPRMFRGGRAELTLTETEDVLEAGIEIQAQPPGKRLQSVNLLSGGEKSLTALALLLAVFSIKPSPFFLLDEVDAALDDANVGRFDALLREMSGRAQFLVITHNQSSIESADTLFGVTMEEAGSSKLVSVDLVQASGERSAQA